MNKIIMHIAFVVVLLLVGCSAETPTQVSSDDADVMAKLVAGAVGYESNGLAATVNDLVVAGTGGTLRASVTGAPNTAVVVTRNDSIFDPQTRSQLLSLACERNRADTYSDWELSYAIQFGGLGGDKAAPVPADPKSAQTRTEGTFRNASLKVQGVSTGKMQFGTVAPGHDVALSGEYRWDGTAVVLGAAEERYEDVAITFNWSHLDARAAAGGNGQYLNGRCDVNIKASSPSGIISRNGTLTFTGGQYGTLALGGKRYLVSVQGAEVVRKG